MYSISGILASLVFCFVLVRVTSAWQKRKYMPPGPTPLPLLGNLLQLPREKEWEVFRNWSRTYGDIISVQIFGDTFFVLNSRKAMYDLLEARSAIYSDRPHLVMADDIMGWGNSVIMCHYNEKFKQYRRLLKISLSQSAIQGYWPLLDRQATMHTLALIEEPASFVDHFRKAIGSLALNIAYGYTDDHMVSLAEQALHMFSLAGLPGRFLVDAVPQLRHIPAWFPGAGFQSLGEHARNIIAKLRTIPFLEVKKRLSEGTAAPSVTATLLQEVQSDSDSEDVKWVSSAIYGGAADTTTAAISNFYLAMVLYPEVQAKAQAEIDRVVGNDRLPRVADRESLPYVDAVMKEVFRWAPVARMVAHSVMQDDVYEGFHIAAGTTVVANIWAGLQDESVYPAPEIFRPERYLAPENAPDSSPLAFGFGRRVCPGIILAHATVFVHIANILATFNITNAVDEAGRIMQPEVAHISGVVNHPKPFKCTIKPRSPAAEQLARRSTDFNS